MSQRTLLQTVNGVMSRLRLAPVSSTTDNVTSVMVAEFVRETHEEVQRAAQWTNLTQTLSASLSPGISFVGGLTGTDDSSKVLSVHLRLTNTLEELTRWDEARMEKAHATPNIPSTKPYAFSEVYDGNELSLRVFPTPDVGYSVRVILRNSVELPTDTTPLSMPWRIVLAGAEWKTRQERGDPPEVTDRARSRYKEYLAEAIALDVERNPGVYDWKPV